LEVGEMYHKALREKEVEVDRLTHELVSTQSFLEGTQKTLQELESRSEEFLEETRQKSTTPILVESQIYPSATLQEDVGVLVVAEGYIPQPRFECSRHSWVNGNA
jgi:hypothetical protein